MASEGKELGKPRLERLFDYVVEKILPIVLMTLLLTFVVGFVSMLIVAFATAVKPIPAQPGNVIQRYEFDGCVVREIEINDQHYLLATAGNQPRSVSICPVPKKPAEEPAK